MKHLDHHNDHRGPVEALPVTPISDARIQA
jgi:hypothetical protein